MNEASRTLRAWSEWVELWFSWRGAPTAWREGTVGGLLLRAASRVPPEDHPLELSPRSAASATRSGRGVESRELVVNLRPVRLFGDVDVDQGSFIDIRIQATEPKTNLTGLCGKAFHDR